MQSRALDYYNKILNGEADARYLITKRTRMRDKTEKDNSGGSLLDSKVESATAMFESCALCERRCRAHRSRGEKGHCGVLDARISSDFLHMGEEPELVPSYTIFFSGCTFECVYCQNWDISTRPDSGVSIGPSMLARRIEQKSKGASVINRARNVNWVGGDPTPNLPFILETLRRCSANIAQVWNSNMYLTEEAMALLDGVIDIYLTDFKYGNDDCARRLSKIPKYTQIVERNHILAKKNAEMIIRHLVLPGHLECCTRPALVWISENLEDVKVNVMGQYRPEHKAADYEEISKGLKMKEYQSALAIAEDLGLDLTE